MSAFSVLAAGLNRAQRLAFGTPVLYQPISGGAAVSISAILSSAAILEDRSPGSYDHAWVVAADLVDRPANGDRITINAGTGNQEIYTVVVVPVDAEGGIDLAIQRT